MLPESSTFSSAVSSDFTVRKPPVFTIKLFAPFPSVPNTNGPINSSSWLSDASINVAVAPSPNKVRTLLSKG